MGEVEFIGERVSLLQKLPPVISLKPMPPQGLILKFQILILKKPNFALRIVLNVLLMSDHHQRLLIWLPEKAGL